MGMMGSKGGRRFMSDINVTPLVDVMLVLLIIFMITAPMMTQSGDINLPETTAVELRPEDEPMTISYGKDDVISLKDTPMGVELLMQTLEKNFPAEEDRKNQIIYFRADKDVPYEKVYALLQKLMAKGFEKVGMVTKPADNIVGKRQ
jgi:biopolymer transport protein TolR